MKSITFGNIKIRLVKDPEKTSLDRRSPDLKHAVEAGKDRFFSIIADTSNKIQTEVQMTKFRPTYAIRRKRSKKKIEEKSTCTQPSEVQKEMPSRRCFFLHRDFLHTSATALITKSPLNLPQVYILVLSFNYRERVQLGIILHLASNDDEEKLAEITLEANL